MALTVTFNDGAHGEIHELLGGAWSRNATAYADKTDSIVQPFIHKAVVSLEPCSCLAVGFAVAVLFSLPPPPPPTIWAGVQSVSKLNTHWAREREYT